MSKAVSVGATLLMGCALNGTSEGDRERGSPTHVQEGIDVTGAVGVMAEALSEDAACAGGSLRLNDGPDQTGNRLCFVQTMPGAAFGVVHLRDFCRSYWAFYDSFTKSYVKRCTATWEGAVRSYQAGDAKGYFHRSNPPSGASASWSFGAHERNDHPPPAVLAADAIGLGDPLQ